MVRRSSRFTIGSRATPAPGTNASTRSTKFSTTSNEGRPSNAGHDTQRKGGRDDADGHADPDHASVRRAEAPGVQGVDHAGAREALVGWAARSGHARGDRPQ